MITSRVDLLGRRRGRMLAHAAVALCVGATVFVQPFAQPSAGAAPALGTTASTAAPALPIPAYASADALPTVQINGVVWGTVVVGRTVYATGSFTKARPAGAAPGTSETTRNNLLAFDLVSGKLITTFAHSLGGAGLAITASPDNTRIYVGGEFTTVDNVARNHVAVFSAATGALLPFAANTSGKVSALTATSSTLYAGGGFVRAAGVKRTNLAAFRASDGALLPWAPTVDGGVRALTVSPKGSRVIVGGSFLTLNGAKRYGLGAVDTSTGAAVSWTNPPMHDYGVNSGFTSLTHDGQNVYGTGFNYNKQGGEGNFEGRFAITDDGTIVWIDDCHGDSYSIVAIGSVAYSAGHSHNCSTQGAFPETTPRTWHRAIASTVTPQRTVLANKQSGYADYAGQPAPTQLDWYPKMSIGTCTGAYQGPWAVSGTSQYVVMGGEFPKVNDVGQQGLVRFAVRSIAPNKIGPLGSQTGLAPTARTVSSSTVQVTWRGVYDNDDPTLVYQVFRDGGSTAIGSVTADSRFYSIPTLSFTDKTAGAGSHRYTIKAYDSAGNVVTGGGSTTTMALPR